MPFADLKNDFVFRRIFASRPDLLCVLLNDLLERSGEHAITSIEYLPSEQLPLVLGAKLSILDVRCKDKSGVTFVVEMQLVHVPGFINRVVYNACKAYAGQLRSKDRYTALTDVVAISICDFELWPDDEQRAQDLPCVPMLSRWAMAERSSKSPGLLQVQYAFLELPKLTASLPQGGADLWAWLFVHAPELKEAPPELPAGPYKLALDLANQASFSQEDFDTYEKVCAELEQTHEFGEVKYARGLKEGHKEGLEEGLKEGHKSGLEEGHKTGLAEGKRGALLDLLAHRGLVLTEAEQQRVLACEALEDLDLWFRRALLAATSAEIFA